MIQVEKISEFAVAPDQDDEEFVHSTNGITALNVDYFKRNLQGAVISLGLRGVHSGSISKLKSGCANKF